MMTFEYDPFLLRRFPLHSFNGEIEPAFHSSKQCSAVPGAKEREQKRFGLAFGVVVRPKRSPGEGDRLRPSHFEQAFIADAHAVTTLPRPAKRQRRLTGRRHAFVDCDHSSAEPGSK